MTECEDDLLRLQPANEASHSEIAEKYSDLCQQVAGWVDDQTEDPQILEDNFEKLKTMEDVPEAIRSYLDDRQFKIGRRYPESLPMLLQNLIHCYLGKHILGNSIYLFGLEERDVALVQGVEQGMTFLEPQRGKFCASECCFCRS